MIIGGSKKEVINNIKKNIENNELNKKVEIGDPNLSEEEINKCLNKFYQNKKFSNDSLFDNIHVDSQKTGEIDKINTELSETYRWFNQLEGVSLNENIANEIKSLI